MNTNLKFLNTLPIISKNFNIPLNFLTKMQLDNNYEQKYFNIFGVPKKNKKRKGEYREIIEIKNPYNIFYKELLHTIELNIKDNKSSFLHEIAYGFIKNRGILQNAEKHLNKKYILKIDVKNFFNSITIDSIEKIFIKLGCNNKGAKLFSHLCTYNGVLKEGFNTSPMLANLYSFDLDKDLQNLALTYKLNVTRYSDDITFSSNDDNFPEIEELKKLFNKYDLELNNEKTIFKEYGQAQYVTGLSISNSKYPRVPRRMKKKIRQQVYYLNKYPENYFYIEDGYGKLRTIYGNIVYLLGIEKELGQKYKSQFLNALHSNGLYLDDILMYPPEYNVLSEDIFHYIDESEIIFNNNKKHYLALTVASISGEKLKTLNQETLKTLKNDILSDFRNGLTENDRRKLFHYVDNNILVKEQYISILRELQFEAFVIFIKSDKRLKKNTYQKYYYRIFSSIMKDILKRFKTSHNYIYFEENNKIKKNKLEKNLLNIKNLPKFQIEELSKDEILLSIPDYVMGIFRDCMKKDLSEQISKLKGEQKIREENKLNEIKDKIRLVKDVDKNIYYSRQNNNKITCREINKSIDYHIKKKNKWIPKINLKQNLLKIKDRYFK